VIWVEEKMLTPASIRDLELGDRAPHVVDRLSDLDSERLVTRDEEPREVRAESTRHTRVEHHHCWIAELPVPAISPLVLIDEPSHSGGPFPAFS